MDSNIQELISSADDDTCRKYSDICDKLCMERYYKNHLKSQTHKKNFK